MWNISAFADEIYGPEAGFEPALALLEKLGIQYTDLRLANGYDSFMTLSDHELDDLQRLLRKYNIRVAALGTPLFKCPLRGSAGPEWGNHHGVEHQVTYRHYLDLLPRAFELGDRFGTENIRCFAFWRQYRLEDVLDEVVEKLQRPVAIAEALGRKLFLENEHNTMAGTGLELASILKAVDSPNLLGIYDDGNSGRIGGTPFPDDYDALRGRIGHVHLKFQRLEVLCGWPTLARPNADVRQGYAAYYPWRQPGLPLRGEVRIGGRPFPISAHRTFATPEHAFYDHYAPFFKALKADGYRGFLAIDTGFEGLSRRRGTENPADAEADVARGIAGLREVLLRL